MIVRIVAGILSVPFLVAGFFLTAGGFDWVEGWVFIGLLSLGQGTSGLIVWRKNPELLRRRGNAGEGTKKWDIACLSLFGLF